jgi:hypothetical protein
LITHKPSHTHIIGYIVDISSLVEELMLGGKEEED